MSEWSIQAAELQFENVDLPACRCQHERIMATAIQGVEQRSRGNAKRDQGKKISPVELAILSKYGFKG